MIEENVKLVKERIARAALAAGRDPDKIVLTAASKTMDAASVARAIAAGISVCGENRVQEMLEKHEQGAYAGARLHFIGHLQKNKVRQVVGLCGLIQSVDSAELLEMINERAALLGICQDILLEVNIAGEASKGGFAPESISHILESSPELANIRVRGLMAIPPISLEKGANRAYFAKMYKLYVDNSVKKYDNISMDFISMGMSGDFEDAIAEGSNMVRVGSAIFGQREYARGIPQNRS